MNAVSLNIRGLQQLGQNDALAQVFEPYPSCGGGMAAIDRVTFHFPTGLVTPYEDTSAVD